jgi:hypothetical protein
MRTLGFIFTVAGFLAGAFAASLDARVMDWSQFVPALLFGGLGVFMMRRAERKEMRSEDRLRSNQTDLDESLSRVVAKLTTLDARKGELTVDAIAPEVDANFRADLATFADARETIAHLYGIRVYAEVMSAFAAGERYLNRVWSSSVDGYLEESRTYLGKALEQFNQAKATLDRVNASG